MNKIDLTLRNYTGIDEAFEGLDLFTSGDFSQLGPRDYELYKIVYRFINTTKIPANQLRGNKLYHETLNMDTILKKNWRCSPKHAEMLERWRINEPTLDDIKRVNNQLLAAVKCKPQPTTKFVYPDNKNR